VPSRQSPTVRRRRLGIELRRLREAAGLTIEDVAKVLDVSDSKISRIETASVGASWRDVRDILDVYRVTGPERDGLIQLARDARQKGWWHQAYGDLPIAALVGLEDAAATIRTYQPLLVPGLLQTEEYASFVLRAIFPDRPGEADRRTEFRMARQALLTQMDPPQFWAVLDEAVLRRHVGGRHILRRQLEHLRSMASRPNITVQVLPFESGEHAAMDGGFAIVEFPESVDPDFVYLEHTTSDLYIEEAQAVRRYSLLFDRLLERSLSEAATKRLLARLAKEL
jgi:transcriptional regulator with XRE-family HTH domain